MTKKGYRTDFSNMSLSLNLCVGTSVSGTSEFKAISAWRLLSCSASKSCRDEEDNNVSCNAVKSGNRDQFMLLFVKIIYTI